MLEDKLNKNPFTVPENYFDRLPSVVQEKCAATHGKAKLGLRVATLKSRLAYAVGVAAVALLAYGGITTIGNTDDAAINAEANGNKIKPPITANSFTKSNAKAYAQFTNTNPINAVDKKSDENNMDEAIMNYLAVEDISVDDILGLEY